MSTSSRPLSKRQRVIQIRNREDAGLPVIECPNCGENVTRQTGHWVPDSLDDYGLIVPGYYTCERAS